MIGFQDSPSLYSNLSLPEEQFLAAVIQDGPRQASATGQYVASFHGYELSAWSTAPSGRSSEVTCVLSHQGRPVARRNMQVHSAGVVTRQVHLPLHL